jgi:H+/Cl- antiporter ClcA
MKRIGEQLRTQLNKIFTIITNDRIRVNILQAIPFWIASLFTGLIAVMYTQLFNFSESLLHKTLNSHGWLIFILAPFNFLIGWAIVKAFAPNAKGSGISQVMASLELPSPKYDLSISKLLSIKIIFIKIISSVFMVMGGGAIGREGPTIQISASIFRILNKLIPESWPKVSQKNFILTGAAAGLAAAFNTPLGGIVFAIEELARIHISFFRTALFTAVIVAGLTAQGLLGPYLYLGYPDVKNLNQFIYIGVIAAGTIAGLLGSYMCKLILKLMKWKQKFDTVESILFVIAAGLFTALVAYFMNDHILGSGKELMNGVLFTSEKHISFDTMAVRIIGPVLSFNVGSAGGIFAPSLAAGASVGSYLSSLFGLSGANANIIILSGMVGFLTGVTRTPFTSAILVLEMTDRHNVIFHLMLAALVSNIAALLIDKHSLYEQLKKIFIEEAKQEIENKNYNNRN